METEKQKINGARSMGRRIRELAFENDMSQKELGRHIGCTATQVSWLMNDKRWPSLRTLKGICDTFNVSADWLLFETGPKQRGDNSFQEPHLRAIEMRLYELEEWVKGSDEILKDHAAKMASIGNFASRY